MPISEHDAYQILCEAVEIPDRLQLDFYENGNLVRKSVVRIEVASLLLSDGMQKVRAWTADDSHTDGRPSAVLSACTKYLREAPREEAAITLPDGSAIVWGAPATFTARASAAGQ